MRTIDPRRDLESLRQCIDLALQGSGHYNGPGQNLECTPQDPVTPTPGRLALQDAITSFLIKPDMDVQETEAELIVRMQFPDIDGGNLQEEKTE